MKTSVSIKQINALAIPALISGISEPILSITDTAIVGNVTENPVESLAAVGLVGTFLSMLIWVLGQTRSAISAIVSQYLGAGKLEVVKNLPAQAIVLITSLSLVIIAVTYPITASIFKLYNASGLILEYCVLYYKIRVFGFPFTLFVIAVFGTFRGLQNTYYPMLIAIVGALSNIILDIVLVYGIDGVVAPMHIEGAAYASVIAQLLMAVMSAYLLLTKTDIPLKFTLPFNPEIQRFVSMILNLFVRTLALNITLYFASAYATGYGKTYIAAYTMAINLWFFGAFFIDGYSSAGNILSGRLYGEKNYQALVNLSRTLIRFGILVGVVLAIVGALLYEPIGRLFTKDPEVLIQFKKVFWLVLLMQPVCALAFIFDGIFKGLGKMSVLRNLLLVTTFAVFLPTLFLFDYLDYKLLGVFIAITAWMLARGAPLILKFRQEFLPLIKNR